MTRPADSIVLGGKVLTMEPHARQDFEGVAIRDGRIVALLQRSETEAFVGEKTRVHDLGARVLMPGFVDVHAHAEVLCRTNHSTIDCRAPEVSCVDDLFEEMARFVGHEVISGGILGERRAKVGGSARADG